MREETGVAKKPKKPGGGESSVFLIGDMEHGFTLVVTNPVLVMHYSMDDLSNPRFERVTAGKDPKRAMAAIVQELITLLRNVDPGDAARYDAGEFAAELHYANTIARLINNNGHVYSVDFCLGMKIDPDAFTIRGRSLDPGNSIIQYIRRSKGTSRKYPLDALAADNLGPLPPPGRNDGDRSRLAKLKTPKKR